MRFPSLAALAGAAAILCGCASAPTQPASNAPVAAYSDSIALSGRLNVRYVKDGEQQSTTANFDWKQDAQRTDVALSTPLGSTAATISVTPQLATLKEGSQPPVSAPDVEALSRRLLGWALPVSGLRGWLQGHAVDSAGKPFAASPAHSEVTTRDGWHLHYVEWQPDSLPPRPKRIDAEHPGGGDVQQMSLRIVINQEEK